MLGIISKRGVKHRFLILIYLICFILSLAPTIVAPPERGFSQGQPEMHQAMDNMVAHGIVVKKDWNFPLGDPAKYPALLTSKTSTLLEEAEYMLNNLQNSKEKQWVEAFVHRMRAIAEMLEKTAQMNKQLPNNPNSISGTPVPGDLPLQPTWPATSAVPGINPLKPSKMVSKFPVTSPELSQVLPAHEYPMEHQAVTKPAALSNNEEESEEDELVRELKSLHKEIAMPIQKLKELDIAPVFTSPATPESPENADGKINDVEEKKEKVKAKLIQEIAEFQRLGGALPNGLINALNNQKTDLTHVPIQNSEESSKSEIEAGMIDKLTIEGLNDLNNEDKEISKTNMENLNIKKNKPFQEEKQVQQMHNYTIQNAHINWHPNFPAFPNQMGKNFHYMPPQNKKQPNQKGLEHAIHDLQKPSPFNLHGKYQTLGSTNHQLGHIPDALKQQMSHPENKIYNSHSSASHYNAYLAKSRHGQYPYLQHWDHKNSTLHMPSLMSPHLTKPSINHQIDTQLSEEMKRELRDGKIIVWSDSVVRSNFEQNEDSQTVDEKRKQPKNENLDNSKNGTQTSN